MFINILVLFLLLNLATSNVDFTFNGFNSANMSVDGSAVVTSNGLLRLTDTIKLQQGYAFYSVPIQFKSSPTGSAFSFSSNFVFAIVPKYPGLAGHGLTFVISPSKDLSGAMGNVYLSLLNPTNNGNSSNHIAAVEFDTVVTTEFKDINDNHVGIDINSMQSINSSTAGYNTTGNGGFTNLNLSSGDPMQVWVEYDGIKMQLNVTLSPMGMAKPSIPLLSATINLSDVILDTMYMGFTSASGTFLTSHFILGWSFKMNGKTRAFDLSSLPSLPKIEPTRKSKALLIWLSVAVPVSVLAMVAGAALIVMRKIKFAEILEEWEMDYGPHRISYKDLYKATKGFEDKELLGAGGFGMVYRGVLPISKTEVAIKRVSHDSRQGMKEFVAEIISIGRLRHRNLVQLLGYCRRKGELLLVYDFMPNGSLDKFLFDRTNPCLYWNQRFHIIKGVASGLLYLHEEWEQVVIHRDIKASNVLLDSEFNGRLGDFGLARLYDHKTGPQTTHVVGTMGYIAPELNRTGKATKAADVYSFGAFLLEVALGRRPIEPDAAAEEVIMVDWVLENWKRGSILRTADPRLRDEYVVEEMELVLKLGLYCSHPSPTSRPSMRQVMQVLDGKATLPELSSEYLITSFVKSQQNEAFDEFIMSFPSSVATMTDSFLSGGR